MRIENGYLQQSMLCSKNNRNAVGNFSDTMNKAQECISNKISTRDSYVNSTDYSNFGIYTQNSISQDIESVSYTHLTLPTKIKWCRSRWSPYH